MPVRAPRIRWLSVVAGRTVSGGRRRSGWSTCRGGGVPTTIGQNKLTFVDILVGGSGWRRPVNIKPARLALPDSQPSNAGRLSRPPTPRDSPLRRGAGQVADAAHRRQGTVGRLHARQGPRIHGRRIFLRTRPAQGATRSHRSHPQLVGRHARGGVDQRGGAARAAGLRRHARDDQDVDRGSGHRAPPLRGEARDLVRRL